MNSSGVLDENVKIVHSGIRSMLVGIYKWQNEGFRGGMSCGLC